MDGYIIFLTAMLSVSLSLSIVCLIVGRSDVSCWLKMRDKFNELERRLTVFEASYNFEKRLEKLEESVENIGKRSGNR